MQSKTSAGKIAYAFCLILFLAFSVVASSQAYALTVNVRTSLGTHLAGIKVYAFTASNTYTGKSSTTDALGAVLWNAK